MVRTKPTIPGIVDRERWAWEQGVKHNLDHLARLVLLRIVYRAGGPDGCFESQAELGKHVGCSRQHVNLHVLPELEALALIVRDGRKRRAAVYHPIVNLMPQSIPAPQLRSVKPRVDKTIEPKCQVQTLQDHVKPRVDTNQKKEESGVRGAHRSESNLDVQRNPTLGGAPPGQAPPLDNPPNVTLTLPSPVRENVSAVVTVGEDWQEAAALVVEEPEPEYRNGTGGEGNSFGHSKGPEPEKSPPPRQRRDETNMTCYCCYGAKIRPNGCAVVCTACGQGGRLTMHNAAHYRTGADCIHLCIECRKDYGR